MNALKSLYSIVDVDSLGDVIGYGLTSVAIKQQNKILVFTKEREKLMLMKALSTHYNFFFEEKESMGDWFSYKIEEFKPINKNDKHLISEITFSYFGEEYSLINPPDFLEEKNKYAKAFNISLKKALTIMENEKFSIDIHEGQFMLFGGEVICIDPIMIDS